MGAKLGLCCYVIFRLIPFIFLLAALGTFRFKRMQEHKYAERIRLYKVGKTACLDVDITNPLKVGDLIKGQCISFQTDFKHNTETCATDLISDGTCGKCIKIDQIVEHFVRREYEKCTTKSGRAVLIDPKDTETIEAIQQESRRQDCHTVIEYVWATGTDFAGLNQKHYQQGNDNFEFKPYNKTEPSGFVPWISTNVSLDLASLKTEPKSTSLYQKCITNEFAKQWSDEISNTNDGYTQVEYDAIPSGSNLVNCDSVHGVDSVGIHRVTAYCHGGEADYIRVVGGMNYTDDTIAYELTDWSDNDDDPLHKILVWDSDGRHTMEESLVDAENEDRETIAGIIKLANRFMALFVVLSFLFFVMHHKKTCEKYDADGSSSTSS